MFFLDFRILNFEIRRTIVNEIVPFLSLKQSSNNQLSDYYSMSSPF